MNGPSGAGVDDLFAPEINSVVPWSAAGDDFTKDNLDTQFYDSLKVQAVINWAKGGNHDGSPNRAGAPAIYGMNFQTVSTAQKLNFSHLNGDGGVKGLGGYSHGGTQPGSVVEGALDYVDAQLGRIVAAIDPKDTVLIISAKHGQSPVDRAQLRLIDDGEVVAALNAAWAVKHPNTTLVSMAMDDDAMLLWLSDRSEKALEFARSFIWNYVPAQVGGSDPAGSFVSYDGTVPHSGLRKLMAGEEAAAFIGVSTRDERVPDLIGITAVGTVYSNPTKIKKIAEHGGDARQDRHVPIIVWGAGVEHVRIDTQSETTQIAPTVLSILGLPVSELKAVKLEHTAPLAGIR